MPNFQTQTQVRRPISGIHRRVSAPSAPAKILNSNPQPAAVRGKILTLQNLVPKKSKTLSLNTFKNILPAKKSVVNVSLNLSGGTGKVVQKIKALKSKQLFLNQQQNITQHTQHKIKNLKKYNKGGQILQMVMDTVPDNIKNPHSQTLPPTKYEMKQSKVETFKKEVIAPNKKVIVTSLALIFGTFLISNFAGVSGKSMIPQSFAYENKTVKNEIEKVKEVGDLSDEEIIKAHKKILEKNKPTVAASGYVLPVPDQSKPAFIEIKDLGMQIDFDLENKKPDPQIYYYDFAGKPGQGQKSYILVTDEEAAEKISNMTPSTKVAIKGIDDKGVEYSWNYSMVSKNTYTAQDEVIFSNGTKANFGIILNTGKGNVELIEARLVNVDKVQ